MAQDCSLSTIYTLLKEVEKAELGIQLGKVG